MISGLSDILPNSSCIIRGMTPDLLCSVLGLVSAVPIVCVLPGRAQINKLSMKKFKLSLINYSTTVNLVQILDLNIFFPIHDSCAEGEQRHKRVKDKILNQFNCSAHLHPSARMPE